MRRQHTTYAAPRKTAEEAWTEPRHFAGVQSIDKARPHEGQVIGPKGTLTRRRPGLDACQKVGMRESDTGHHEVAVLK